MPTVALPQGTIEYFDEGDPTGTPVVCVHGFLAGPELWATTAQALGDRVRVLRPALPLGSHRIPVAAPPTPRGVAEIVLAFLDALELEDPILLGNDTGGAVCQMALDTSPHRVRRVVLTNCDAFDQFPPGLFGLLRPASKVPGLITALMQGTRIPLLRHALVYGLLAARRDDELWEAWVSPFLDDRRIRRQALELMRTVDPQELLGVTTGLARWGGDALLVWGMRDRFFTPALGRRLAAVLGAELLEIPEAKTFVPLDAPAQLADVVAGFAAAAGSHAAGSAPAAMEAAKGSR